jgi:hypothetical protein
VVVSKVYDSSRASQGKVKLEAKESNLIVANQPDARSLVVLVVGYHNVVRSHLQEISIGDFHLARIVN